MSGARRAMVGSVLALVLLLPAVPAVAGAATVRDRAGDSGRALDLLRLDVRHAEPTGPRRLVLKVRHGGLPSFDSGIVTTVRFWIDIDGSDHGPEFVVDITPNTGGFALHRVLGWNRGGEQEQPCPRLRARADVFSDGPVLLKVPRVCLGDPRRARAAVIALGETTRGRVVDRDWMGSRRHWSPWVRR